MKTKGFTLAELIGVVIIIAIILLLVAIPVTKRIQDGKTTVYESQIKIIELGAEGWISNNIESLPKNEGETVTITVGTLKQDGELEKDLVDPTTGKCIPNNTQIKITRKNGKYEIVVDIASGTDECPEIDSDTPIIYLNGEALEYVEYGTPWNDPGAIAKTNTGIPITDVTAKVTKNGPTVDTNQFKDYEVTYSATDKDITVTVIRTIIIVDTTPPELNIPDDSVISSEITSIDLMEGVTAIDNADGDITDKVKIKGKITPGELGEYVITYEVEDSHGNKSTATRKIRIEDKTKPTSTATVLGNVINSDGWAKKNFDVKIRIDDEGGSGPAGFRYCQTTSSTCTPNITVDEVVQNITVSTHSASNMICVIPFDNAGNNGNRVCYGPYKLDKVDPTVALSINSTPTYSDWYGSNISISVSTNDPSVSNVKYYKYCKSTSGECTPNITVNRTSDTLYISTEGRRNYICAESYDYAGNVSEKACKGPLKLDKYSPSISLSSTSSSNGNGWYDSNVSFSVSTSDSASGVRSYTYCKSSSGTCTPYTTVSSTSGTLTISTQGSTNYVCAYATDNVYRTSDTECEGPIKLDKEPPTISLTDTVTITQFDTINVWDGVSYSDNLTPDSSLSASTSGSVSTNVNGTYYVDYSVTDLAGNTETVTRTYIINVRKYTVDVNSIIDNVTHSGGKSSFTFDVYRSDTDTWSYGQTDWYTSDFPHGAQLIVNVNSRDGYSLRGGGYNGTITSDTEVNPTWYDDIPPTITNFRVNNLGYYDPSMGAAKGWNVEISIEGYDNGTGIQKYQTWLHPRLNGSGAGRSDGGHRTFTNVLYLNTDEGRTFCAYAIDGNGNESERCSTCHTYSCG